MSKRQMIEEIMRVMSRQDFRDFYEGAFAVWLENIPESAVPKDVVKRGIERLFRKVWES